ncbi:uncharacterized protein LOC134747381 [Cydia strobilella]|uniref:uncharacterized protein LOC134747381 n=1 Tax=Cydia strobilella TaxID=1100964 RepID=UPI003003B2CF
MRSMPCPWRSSPPPGWSALRTGIAHAEPEVSVGHPNVDSERREGVIGHEVDRMMDLLTITVTPRNERPCWFTSFRCVFSSAYRIASGPWLAAASSWLVSPLWVGALAGAMSEAGADSSTVGLTMLAFVTGPAFLGVVSSSESAQQFLSMDSLNDFRNKGTSPNFEKTKLGGKQHVKVLQEKVISIPMENYVQIGLPHDSPGLDNESIPTPTSTINDCDLALTTPEAPIYSPITPIDKYTFLSGNKTASPIGKNTFQSINYENASPDSIQDSEISTAISDAPMNFPVISENENIIIGDSSETNSPVRSISISPDQLNVIESLLKSNAFEFGDLNDDSVKDPDFAPDDDSDDSSSDDSTRVSSSVLTVADVHIEKPTSSFHILPLRQKGQLQSNKNDASSHVPMDGDGIEVFTEIGSESREMLGHNPELHAFVPNARKRRASENDLLETAKSVKKVRRSASLSGLILPLEQNKPISPKKRARSDPTKWKRYVQREKRARGEAYKTVNGKDIAARPIKEPRCVTKPKHKCNENVPKSLRESIYNSFRSLKSLDEQRHFIALHVHREQKKRSTTDGPSRKECTNHYSFTIGENTKVHVCREFFLDTLNITEGMVRGTLKKVSSEGVLEQDNRGRKSPPNKLSADRLNDIKSHIFSFPTMDSHYCRSTTEYKYLEASLNIQTMHTLYKEQCVEKELIPACSETYRNIFRSYKLKFHVPKKDLCKTCIAFKNGDTSSDDHAKHLKRRDESYRRRDADKNAANNDVTTLAFNFDLEAVLHTHKGPAGPFFYVRKLAVYNLTFYKFGNQDVDCYTWDETEGNRGSIEIATCVYKYIVNNEGITHVRMMSDNCGGQQKNYAFCCMLLHLVSTHQTIEVVDHVFYESGHSHMECDSVHSKIEQKAKKIPIYTPDGWIQVMRTARMNPRPFKVNIMGHEEFLNFNSNEVKFAVEATKRPRKKKSNKSNEAEENASQDETEKKEKTNFSNAVWIQYRKESPKSIFIKTDYNETQFTELKLKPKRGKSAAIVPARAYATKIPISKAKKRDLMKLCHDNQIPRCYHSYYESLPDSEECDRKSQHTGAIHPWKRRNEPYTQTPNSEHDIRVFTDGSKIEGKVGAALSMWSGDTETKALKLALSAYCTVYQAELLALS